MTRIAGIVLCVLSMVFMSCAHKLKYNFYNDSHDGLKTVSSIVDDEILIGPVAWNSKGKKTVHRNVYKIEPGPNEDALLVHGDDKVFLYSLCPFGKPE